MSGPWVFVQVSQEDARNIAMAALDSSAYFQVLPLPDGVYEVSVREDRADLVSKYQTRTWRGGAEEDA